MLIVKDVGLKLINDWNKIFEGTKIPTIIGIIIQFIMYFLGFYFSFGFCAVYKYQQFTWVFIVGFAFVFDMIVLELLIELIIATAFIFRKKNRFWLTTLQRLNDMRDFRTLNY